MGARIGFNRLVEQLEPPAEVVEMVERRKAWVRTHPGEPIPDDTMLMRERLGWIAEHPCSYSLPGGCQLSGDDDYPAQTFGDRA